MSAKINEVEYWSLCCDAPPINEDALNAVNGYMIGYCMSCRMGSKFKLGVNCYEETKK